MRENRRETERGKSEKEKKRGNSEKGAENERKRENYREKKRLGPGAHICFPFTTESITGVLLRSAKSRLNPRCLPVCCLVHFVY